MKYVYPAIFHAEDGKILVDVPDLPGTHTFGNDLQHAIEMARDAIEMWLSDAESTGEAIPAPSAPTAITPTCDGGFVSLVTADTDAYRRANDNRAVKKTLSIPSWLNHRALEANAPFSQILQEGLKAYLGFNS
jgi:predicted RNase H-like HicB family nuclease